MFAELQDRLLGAGVYERGWQTKYSSLKEEQRCCERF